MTTQINNSSRYFTSIRVGTLTLGTKPGQQFTYTSPITLGLNAGKSFAAGTASVVVIGDNTAPSATAGGTTIVGSLSASTLTSGDITLFGYNSGVLVTTGSLNSFFGAYITTLGNVNFATALGSNSYGGESCTSAGYSAKVGALTSVYNTSVGTIVGTTTMGSYNTTCGGGSLRTGSAAWNYCCAFGFQALGSGSKTAAVDGSSAFGYQSLANISSGAHNTGFGYQTGVSCTTASYNAYFGYRAGYAMTGSYNTIVGSDTSGTSVSGTVALGYGVTGVTNNFVVTVGGASPATILTDCTRHVAGSTGVPAATDYWIVSFNGTAKKIALYD